jgi:hypothetical protein
MVTGTCFCGGIAVEIERVALMRWVPGFEPSWAKR